MREREEQRQKEAQKKQRKEQDVSVYINRWVMSLPQRVAHRQHCAQVFAPILFGSSGIDTRPGQFSVFQYFSYLTFF